MRASEIGLIVVFATVAVVGLTAAHLGWRVARRWNTLLRRNGMTADDDVFAKNGKLMRFLMGDEHQRFGDHKLSSLVRASRWAIICSAFAVLVIWPLAIRFLA